MYFIMSRVVLPWFVGFILRICPMTLVYANCMWVCVCVTVSVYVVVVWQGPMEEQFLYWMDFTLYKYIWNKKKVTLFI